MFGNCNHCCFCCGHPCTMLGVSLSISCKNKIQCVCVEKKKKISEWAWAWQCFNRALFIDTDTWISYNFHVQWNIIILLILFNHEKCIKTILHLWAVQKQELGQAWPKEFSLPTPILAWLDYMLSWDQICCCLSLVSDNILKIFLSTILQTRFGYLKIHLCLKRFYPKKKKNHCSLICSFRKNRENDLILYKQCFSKISN